MRPRQASRAWPSIAALWLTAAGCNPFLPVGGAEGDPCQADADCVGDLTCSQQICTRGTVVTDADLDGHDAIRFGGDDCDDTLAQVHPGAAEVCDGRDNDCDSSTRESDLIRDCVRQNAFGACQGTERCDDRHGDWIDCTAQVPAAEDCDGLDNNCDGQTDEDLTERACPLTDGVCAGAMQTCLGQGGWSVCDYGPDYQATGETRCDQLDNDCDGITDEDVLVLEPELDTQASDGIDNNCNGLIDEPGGMLVPVRNHPGTWIGAFEISLWEQADCSGTRYGELVDDYPAGWPADASNPSVSLYACSLGGVIPSGHLSWYRARRACESQGMRLCDRNEFASACARDFVVFPYGPEYAPDACNTPDGLGQGQPVLTGFFSQCTAYGLTFDMSGNLVEWISEWVPEQPIPGLAWVASWGYSCEFCFWGSGCRPCNLTIPVDNDRLKDLTNCPVGDHDVDAYPRDMDRPDFGARCCFDGP